MTPPDGGSVDLPGLIHGFPLSAFALAGWDLTAGYNLLRRRPNRKTRAMMATSQLRGVGKS